MNHENDFDLRVCCEDKRTRTTATVISDWILMIALSRQKCFHFSKRGSVIDGFTFIVPIFFFLPPLIPPASVWPSCSLMQTFSLGLQRRTERAPCLQAHVKSELSGTSRDPRRFSGPPFWTVAHFHPDRWNVKTKTFSSLQQSVKDSALKKSDFAAQRLLFQNFDKCAFQMINI